MMPVSSCRASNVDDAADACARSEEDTPDLDMTMATVIRTAMVAITMMLLRMMVVRW